MASDIPLVELNKKSEEQNHDSVHSNIPLVALYTSFDDAYSENEGQSAPNENHKRAAFFVKEGRDNEKFATLPEKKSALISYKILHHPVYYWLVWLSAVALMLLAAWEEPSVFVERKPTAYVHLIFELILLSVFAVDLALRLIWLGPRLFFKSRATIVCIILLILCLEVVVIFLTGNRHIRITRAFRSIFLIDAYVMFAVRRVVRQIFICLKYIVDVMLALFFLVAVFSLIGYFLFTEINPTYFDTLTRSIVSMIITLTTANHPNVFMEAYYKTAAAPIFFMIYMLVTFYYFTNVLLAVVFAKFKSAERKKFKKLLLHKYEALLKAFDILKCEDNSIKFIDFLNFMKIYAPRNSDHEVMCLFKALQDFNNNNNCLRWEEFIHFYEFVHMKWTLLHNSGIAVSWYHKLNCVNNHARNVLQYCHKVVKHLMFDTVITGIVIINLLYIIIYIIVNQRACDDEIGNDRFCSARQGVYGSLIFNIIYVVEILFRLFLDGPLIYFRKWNNWFDFVIVFGSFVCLCIEIGLINTGSITEESFRFIAMVRPLKLLRLFRLKRSYFYLIQIMIVLVTRMTSVLFLLVIVYYVFAIIGMEVFTGQNAVHIGCCVNASYGIGTFYSNNGTYLNNPNFYWLNNFDDLGRSIVTLYEEMVVNNWYVQMEGFVSTTSQAARLYFILFWMITTIVLNIAIVYIVDAFESGLLALKTDKKIEDDERVMTPKRVIISGISELRRIVYLVLTDNDIELLKQSIKRTFQYQKSLWFSVNHWIRKGREIPPRTISIYNGEFRGKSLMTNDDLRMLLYEAEVEEWIHQYNIDRVKPKVKQIVLNRHSNKMSFRHIINQIGLYIWTQIKRIFFYILG